MKQVIYFLFSMLLFLSISCNKGEDISFEETPYYLGYFEGKVNSQDISIANQSNSHSFIVFITIEQPKLIRNIRV